MQTIVTSTGHKTPGHDPGSNIEEEVTVARICAFVCTYV
jgi:hypothetical protein